ncbi:hypothetical protein COCCADRAFT_80775, partial [Bipolaris zeicola 26-R-13]
FHYLKKNQQGTITPYIHYSQPYYIFPPILPSIYPPFHSDINILSPTNPPILS